MSNIIYTNKPYMNPRLKVSLWWFFHMFFLASKGMNLILTEGSKVTEKTAIFFNFFGSTVIAGASFALTVLTMPISPYWVLAVYPIGVAIYRWVHTKRLNIFKILVGWVLAAGSGYMFGVIITIVMALLS